PPPITGTFMPPKPDLVFNTAPTAIKIDHHAFNVQLSPTKPEQDFSNTTRPSAPIIEDWVFDSEPIKTFIPAATPASASPKSTSSGKRRNRKACFVCKSVDHLIKDCDYHAKKMAQPTQRNYEHRGNHKQYALLTRQKPQKHMVPTAMLTQSKPVFNTAVRPVSAAVPKITRTRPRLAHPIVTKSKLPIRRHITRSPSLKTSNSPPRVTAAQALVVIAAQGMQGKWGNPQHALKDKRVINSGCSRYMIGNMSYLSDFEELNGGYVAFGEILPPLGLPPKATYPPLSSSNRFTWVFFLATKDKTSPILKTLITGLENQLSLKVKVIRSDNRTEFKNHNLNQFCGLKGIKREFSVPRTPQQNSIAERKNKTFIEAARTILADSLLPIPFWAEAVNTACYNYDGDAAFDEKEHDFDAKKPEYEVILSPSSSAQSRKQDDKTKKEAKGKSPVESFT
nr:putative ribonuclease H-like domain-containing protein [Tanacetum cinerariifolium]